MDMISIRRNLMAKIRQSGGGRLPAKYQEVEYLENTGETQWIDVGFPITDTLSIQLTFSAVTTDSGKYYMGLYTNNQGDFYLYNSGGFFSVVYGSSYANARATPADKSKHTFYISFEDGNTVVRENGEIVESIPKYNPLKSNRHIRIAGSYLTGQNKSRTYAFVAHDGANKVANFVPCYRKADDKPGMYDLVSDTFLVNKGTGEFIAGPDIN